MASDSMDYIHWDVGFALKKMAEQLQEGQFKRLIISADRSIFDLAVVRGYLERTHIENFARLQDIYNKAEQILNWHNHALENLDPAAAGVVHSFNLPYGGFLQISSPIECIAIHGKNVMTGSSTQAAYDRFFEEHPVFKLYSSREFARACDDLLNILSAYYPQLAGTGVSHSAVRTAGSNNLSSIIPSMPSDEQFICMLYHKTIHSSYKDYPPALIGKLIAVAAKEVRSILIRLAGLNWVDTAQGYGDNVAITAQGIQAGHDLLMRYKVIVIRFTSARYLEPTSRAEHRVLFVYEIVGTDQQEIDHTLAAVVSDVLAATWGVPFGDDKLGERLLLLHAKDYIRRKLVQGTLQQQEEMEILAKDLSVLPVYTAAETVSVQQAEFLVIPALPAPVPEHTAEELGTWIVKTRTMINTLFKKKHKESLLKDPETQNLLDLHREALDDNAYYRRVSSLGTTLEGMNVGILRQLTNIMDPEIKSIGLLEVFLKTLTPDTDAIIKPMRKLKVLRNAYPAHKDTPETIDAYGYFSIKLPITDYAGSWRLLLNHYWMTLEKMYAMFLDKWG